eukprot:CAMPEP_0198284564 /NCGR_PEP_ID=MMETSP1449-20131203/4021_1 /TAXON_ID=420275 /ORGANISM="Attheya septentrionalis, Strain CCMP2084" /LENGTH=254 /DNA_ID=CAMNT_0043981679 /DNA_START=63 /DNA_END=827 /DNA_ORIENTATION=+
MVMTTTIESDGPVRSVTPDPEKHENDDELVALFERRVKALERRLYDFPEWTVEMQRARRAVESLGIYSSVWKWVPSNYYSRSLAERAKCLGASQTTQLCKSMLMENNKFQQPHHSDKKKHSHDKTNARFYLVVVQYEATIVTKKLESEIRALKPVAERLEPSQFDMRLAKEQDNDAMTGYGHNSVTPFGLVRGSEIPIILSKAILDETVGGFLWMGGGHVHHKLGMSVHDFIQATGAIVADISEPRTADTHDEE